MRSGIFSILAGFAILFYMIPCFADEPVDLLRSLYQKRFQLDEKGVPLVLVGMAQGLEKIEITSADGVDVLPHGPSGVRIQGSLAWTVRLVQGNPGRAEHYVALETVPSLDADALSKTRAALAERKPVLREQGYVIFMGSRLIDTRRTLFSLGPLERPKIPELLEREQNAFPYAFAYDVPAALPSGIIEISTPDGRFRIRQAGAAAFESAGASPLAWMRDGKPHRVAGRLIAVVGMDGRLTLVNEISIEKYLEGILPSEMFPSAPPEALKAQAVAARGQVLSKMGQRHHTDPFHLCAQVHCQVYDGLEKTDPRTSAAVAATTGMFLFDAAGRPVDTVYSASCGGHGENNENVWGGKPNSNLRGRPDGPETGHDWIRFITRPPASFCAKLPGGVAGFRWKTVKTPAELEKSLSSHGFSGPVKDLHTLRRGVSGRILELEVIGNKGQKITLRGELTIRQALGGLRSSLFVHRRLADGSLEFTGAGFGHGVGLCQWGAMGRAQAGQNFKEILSHYYQNSQLISLY